MKIQHKYQFDQNLTKITKIGPGHTTLRSTEYFENLFSDGFVAKPNPQNLKDFDTKRIIEWEINFDDAQPVDSITNSMKEKLEDEKNKLVEKIRELREKLQEPNIKNREQINQDLYRYEAFSFDWDTPKPENIYQSGDNLTIINWGLGDIPPPEPPDPPKDSQIQPGTDKEPEGSNGNGGH